MARRILLAIIEAQKLDASEYAILDTATAVTLIGGAATAHTVAATDPSSVACCKVRNIRITSGKHYWESTHTFGATNSCVGLVSSDEVCTPDQLGTALHSGTHSFGAVDRDGKIYGDGDLLYTAASNSANTVVRHYFDADSGLYMCAANNGPWLTVFNDPALSAFTWDISAWIKDDVGGPGSSGNVTLNFGASAFTYDVPINMREGVYNNAIVDTTLYFSTEGLLAPSSDTTITEDGISVTIPAYTLFSARIAADRDVTIVSEGSCWVQGGESESSRGELAIVVADGLRDELVEYLWRDATVYLLEGEVGDDLGDFTIWSTAIVEDKSYDDHVLSLILTDELATLDRTAQDELYPADASNAQIQNKPKPFAFGRPLFCPPILLQTNQTQPDAFSYELDSHAVFSIDAIYDMGDIFEPGVDWNYLDSRKGFQLVNEPDGIVTATFTAAYVSGTIAGVLPNVIIDDSNGGKFTAATMSGWSISVTGTGTTNNAGFGDEANEGLILSTPAGTGFVSVASANLMANAADTTNASRYLLRFDIVAISPGTTLVIEDDLGPIASFDSVGAKELSFIPSIGAIRIVFIINGSALSVSINNVELNWTPLTVAEYLPEVIQYVLEARAGVPTNKIDYDSVNALADKAGVAYRLAYYNDGSQPVTYQELLRLVANSFTGYVASNRLGKIMMGRFEFPQPTEALCVARIDTTNIVGTPTRVQDKAEGLSTSIAGGKNNAPHSDSDIVTSATPEFREELKAEYTIIKTASPDSLDTAVNPQVEQAIAAPAQETLLMDGIALQAEDNRVCTLWREEAGIVTVSAIFDRATANAIELGESVFMVYPRYGFDNGRSLLIKKITRSFFSNLLTLDLFEPDEMLAAGSFDGLRVSGEATPAVNGAYFSFKPRTVNATAPTYSQTGSLPTGTSFDSGTGEIVGVPTVDGDYAGRISAVDSDGRTSHLDYLIKVQTPTPNDTGITPRKYFSPNVTVDKNGKILDIEDHIPSDATLWDLQAKTSATSGDPGAGYLLWDNATQTSAANINVSRTTTDGLDLADVIGQVASGTRIILQDSADADNFQLWELSSDPVDMTSYWELPVTLVDSGGTGTTGFANDHAIVLIEVTGSGGGAGVSSPAILDCAETAHGFVVGTPVARTGGHYVAADITDPNKPCIGLVKAVIDANNFTLQTVGKLTLTTAEWDAIAGTSGGLTDSQWYALGGAGTITETPTGSYQQVVLLALSTTDALIQIGDLVAVTSTVGRSDYGTLIQSAGSTGNGASLNITLGSTPQVGNVLLLVLIGGSSGNSWVQPTLSQTNVAWTKLDQITQSASADVEVWKGVISASAGTTLTITKPSGSYFYGGSLYEWKGVSGTLLSSSKQASGTSSVTWGNAVGLSVSSNCLLLYGAVGAAGAGIGPVPASPFVYGPGTSNFTFQGYINGPLLGYPVSGCTISHSSTVSAVGIFAVT